MKFILNSSNIFNGFDDFGHYLRAQLQITNCVELRRGPRSTGCDANWLHDLDHLGGGPAVGPAVGPFGAPERRRARRGRSHRATKGTTTDATTPDDATADTTTDDTTDDAASTDATSGSTKGTKDLLNFLIGDGQ